MFSARSTPCRHRLGGVSFPQQGHVVRSPAALSRPVWERAQGDFEVRQHSAQDLEIESVSDSALGIMADLPERQRCPAIDEMPSVCCSGANDGESGDDYATNRLAPRRSLTLLSR